VAAAGEIALMIGSVSDHQPAAANTGVAICLRKVGKAEMPFVTV